MLKWRGYSRLLMIPFLMVFAVAGCNFSNSPTDVEVEQPVELDISDFADLQNEIDFEQQDIEKGRWHRDRECLKRCLIYGHFKELKPTWIVSHFSEEIATGGASQVGGGRVKAEGCVWKLGQTEIKVSAAWDWAQPAAGRFRPRGHVSGPSATVLTENYKFAVDPYLTADPFKPILGDIVKAKATSTLDNERGDKIYGDIVGGEVYELNLNGTPGDGQEQFFVVKVSGGEGRFLDAQGYYLVHNILDIAGQSIVRSRVFGLARVPCKKRGVLDD